MSVVIQQSILGPEFAGPNAPVPTPVADLPGEQNRDSVRLYCQEGRKITVNTRRRVFSLLIPAVLAVLIACGVEEDTPASSPNDVPSRDSVGEPIADAVPRSTPPPATSSTELQEARIHSISVIVLESDPPQYTAQVGVI